MPSNQSSEVGGTPSVGRTDAGKRFRWHRVDWLVLGHPQRILIAHQSLRVQFERLAHQFSNSAFVRNRALLSIVDYDHLPPYYHPVQDVTPYTGHGGAEFTKGFNGIIVKQIAHLVVEC